MRKCKLCSKEFDKPNKGYMCYPCRYITYDYKKNYGAEYQKNKREKEKEGSYKRELLTTDECYKWIAKCYDKKFFIDMHGLSDLIYVYDSLGGSQQDLDEMRPGKQLSEMWKYVNNKFLKEYKNILDIEI